MPVYFNGSQSAVDAAKTRSRSKDRRIRPHPSRFVGCGLCTSTRVHVHVVPLLHLGTSTRVHVHVVPLLHLGTCEYTSTRTRSPFVALRYVYRVLTMLLNLEQEDEWPSVSGRFVASLAQSCPLARASWHVGLVFHQYEVSPICQVRSGQVYYSAEV